MAYRKAVRLEHPDTSERPDAEAGLPREQTNHPRLNTVEHGQRWTKMDIKMDKDVNIRVIVGADVLRTNHPSGALPTHQKGLRLAK